MQELKQTLTAYFAEEDGVFAPDGAAEPTLVVPANKLLKVVAALYERFNFSQLIDIVGVDYSQFGAESMGGDNADDGTGDSADDDENGNGNSNEGGQRYAVVYHLLSVADNRRLRVRAFCDDDAFPCLPSVTTLWRSADWYEREVFDLFGIVFDGHEDLRRILTDYGFVGHPFRKDFPLSGNMEMRYDPQQKRVIYQPVSIPPREITPRIIREDAYGKEEAAAQPAAQKETPAQ